MNRASTGRRCGSAGFQELSLHMFSLQSCYSLLKCVFQDGSLPRCCIVDGISSNWWHHCQCRSDRTNQWAGITVFTYTLSLTYWSSLYPQLIIARLNIKLLLLRPQSKDVCQICCAFLAGGVWVESTQETGSVFSQVTVGELRWWQSRRVLQLHFWTHFRRH